MFQALRFIVSLSRPFWVLYLKSRARRGKEDPFRVSERLGKASITRPKGPLVWLHAASVGESLSVLELIQKFLDAYSNLTVLVTSGTKSSADLLKNRLPPRAYHQYVPFDVPQWVNRFLNHWRPDLFLCVESEFWPSLLYAVNKRSVPIILLNGRVSDKTFRNWGQSKWFIRTMLQKFTLCLAQSAEDALRLKSLGAQFVKNSGNLKFTTTPLQADKSEVKRFKEMIGERPIWLAASTHEGEEAIIAQTHYKLCSHYPDLLTVIVPRHPSRGKKIATLLRDTYNFNVNVRTQGDLIQKRTNIYVADTLGELGLFYRLAVITFVGGSLVPIGGHNLIEAAQLDCAILHGPYMDNFRDIVKVFSKNHASVAVSTADDCAQKIKELLESDKIRNSLSNAAKKVANQQGDILDKVFIHLTHHLNKTLMHYV